MIRFITENDVLGIRNEVLREGRLTPEECRFATDTLPGSFHLGYYVGEALACIASFHIQSYEDQPGKGYQLRGMASLPQYRGQGTGTKLVAYAIAYLQQQDIDYVWCNARKNAVPFYERLGFNTISEEFEVPGIGPHYVMLLPLKQSLTGGVI